MRALRWHGRGDVRIDDVEEPAEPLPDEVTVAVEWCGICGTDLEEYLHGPLLLPTTPHPLTGHQVPLALGHEVSGRVIKAGAAAGLEIGQLVALDGYYFCGACPGCARHEVQLCDRWGHIGLSAPGGLAERMTVPARMAVPATADIPSDELAMAEPFSVAVRALRRGALQTRDRVLVLGGGSIGLSVLQVAQAAGASVTVVEPHGARRTVAAQLGAAVSADAAELPAGFDLALDCTGVPAVVAAGLRSLRKGGRMVVVGIPLEGLQLDLRRLVLDELSILGTIGHVYDEDFATAVRLICERRVDPGPLITHRLGLTDAVDQGFALLADRSDALVVKVLVRPAYPAV